MNDTIAKVTPTDLDLHFRDNKFEILIPLKQGKLAQLVK